MSLLFTYADLEGMNIFHQSHMKWC